MKRPELIVYDFDGVMTDNRVTVDQDGKESVTVSRGDGAGVTRGLIQASASGVHVARVICDRN